MRYGIIAAGLAACALAACSGGATSIALPARMETYTTDHNQFARVRVNSITTATQAADNLVLRNFDTLGGSAGHANLFADVDLPATTQIEVIAATADGRPTRILRMTADQGPFTNRAADGTVIAGPDSTHIYHYRGDATLYAQINDGPLMVGYSANDTNIAVDFARQSVDLLLRTGQNSETGSELRSEINAKGLTIDRNTGSYGGDILLQIWSPDSPIIYDLQGVLRGNIAATPDELRDRLETSTSSGLFYGNAENIRAQGLFWATHPNARPQ